MTTPCNKMMIALPKKQNFPSQQNIVIIIKINIKYPSTSSAQCHCKLQMTLSSSMI